MKWFKHLIASGDDPDIGAIISRFGFKGYYLFFRTLEIMADEFDVENPGEKTFNFQWFLGRFSRKIDKKMLINFLNFCQNSLEKSLEKERIIYSLDGKKIYINFPKLKELTDDYTARILRSKSEVNPNEIRSKSEVNSSHRSKSKELRTKNKEVNKDISSEKNKSFDEKFNELWEIWPSDSKGKKPYCKTKFLALCKAGKLEEFRKTQNGYFQVLEYKYKVKNFDQQCMNLSTFLNNWEGDKELYVDFKYKPRL